jgi:3-hydroxyisobutyrate dehydrogenase-like beta-hydroxyacid dehydrogenase
VGAALRSRGVEVLWVGEGRSQSTRDRASAAGLTETATRPELIGASSVVLSICPPEAALQVAGQVAADKFEGVFVDANAISAQSARQIEELIVESGARFVDGGIIGGPPAPGGDTRVYFSGTGAAAVAAMFEDSDRLTAMVLEGPVGAASALKMCYAAWTKGTTALLLAVRAAAAEMDVEHPLLREWELSQPELVGRFARIVTSTPSKAWRFVAEMEQIAESFDAVGVPGGFHRAAAEVFSRLAQFQNQKPGPFLEELLAAVQRPNPETVAGDSPAPPKEPCGPD